MEFRKIVVTAFVAAALAAGLVIAGILYGRIDPYGLAEDPGQRLQVMAQSPELIIEDDHHVAWMPVSNWFANDGSKWKPDVEHWKGLVFQLGLYRGLDKTTGYPDSTWTPEPMEILVTIVGTGSSSPLNLTVDKYQRWINVMAVDNLGRPQHPNPSNPKYEPMDQAIACVLAPGMPQCSAGNTVCTALESSLTPVQLECLRRKSLHRGFIPYRVLTYWPGPNGYDLTAKRYTAFHVYYTFTLLDPITLTVDGNVPANLGTIEKIIVKHNPSYAPPPNRHMDTEDPPWPIP